MCFLKANNEVIYLYSYFFPMENLQRNFVSILKQSHVASNEKPHSNYYKIINSYKVKIVENPDSKIY